MLGCVLRTEQIWLEPSALLADLCHSSKNLYNKANFLIRQAFFQTSQWLRYQALPAQTAQQILKILDQNWKAFFITMKAYKKDPEKFHGQPCPPGYKRKDGEFLLAFTNQ